jgi:hypothetical protein
MTKLVEWLGGAGLFAGVWAYLFISTPVGNSSDFARHFVLFLPFYVLLAFAVSFAFTIVYFQQSIS